MSWAKPSPAQPMSQNFLEIKPWAGLGWAEPIFDGCPRASFALKKIKILILMNFL